MSEKTNEVFKRQLRAILQHKPDPTKQVDVEAYKLLLKRLEELAK